jgi:hypothetical protein
MFIEAKIYPNILRLNRRTNRIKIAVIYQEKEHLAKKMAEFLKKEGVDVVVSKKIVDADGYIIFKKIKGLEKKGKLIFGVYPDMIKDVMVTLYIGLRVKPYINLYMIKKAGIKIDPTILKVSKIYE